MKQNTEQLVDAEELRRRLWAANCRPGLRTIRRWQKQKIIPCIRIGRGIFFDLQQVRESLKK